jgi:PAS domain S-box-containing protein
VKRRPPRRRATAPRRTVAELTARLAEAEETLRAIGGGGVDALVVQGPGGERVRSLDPAEHSFRVLVETMVEGAATVGEDGRIVFCNRAFARLLRRPLAEVMGTRLRDHVAPHHLPAFDALVAAGGKGEVALRRRDGDPLVPTYLSVAEMRVDEERLLCVVATDLTEQKRSEQVLAAERLARAVIDRAAESIVVCDATGRILRASGSAAELCGASPLWQPFERAFDVRPPQGVAPGTAPGPAARAVAAALRGVTVRGLEGRLVRPDGTAADVQVSAAPIDDALGRLVGCVVTLTDITERRRYEQEREELLGRVEALVAGLQRALDARDEFLSIASHELKTPLTALNLHLEGLLRQAARGGADAVPPAVQERLRVVERQGKRIGQLVNDLLDVTRIRAGRVALRVEEVDLAALVADAVERMRGAAAQAGCELTLAVEGPASGRWDRSRLDQVVVNLLSNALKYGRGRPVAVRVEGGPEEVRLSVADGGIGIAPEDHARIFKRFERAVTTPEYGGLGLGLWIAHEIVRLLGGAIRVESRLGAGARFVVELPTRPAPAAAGPPGASGRGAEVEPPRGA